MPTSLSIAHPIVYILRLIVEKGSEKKNYLKSCLTKQIFWGKFWSLL